MHLSLMKLFMIMHIMKDHVIEENDNFVFTNNTSAYEKNIDWSFLSIETSLIILVDLTLPSKFGNYYNVVMKIEVIIDTFLDLVE